MRWRKGERSATTLDDLTATGVDHSGRRFGRCRRASVRALRAADLRPAGGSADGNRLLGAPVLLTPAR